MEFFIKTKITVKKSIRLFYALCFVGYRSKSESFFSYAFSYVLFNWAHISEKSDHTSLANDRLKPKPID